MMGSRAAHQTGLQHCMQPCCLRLAAAACFFRLPEKRQGRQTCVCRPQSSFGKDYRPSRSLRLRSTLRWRRSASDCSRNRLSHGFSYVRRSFISRKMPSRCIFFFSARSAWSTLLSRTETCKLFTPSRNFKLLTAQGHRWLALLIARHSRKAKTLSPLARPC